MSRDDVKEVMVLMADALKGKPQNPQKLFNVWADKFWEYSKDQLMTAAYAWIDKSQFFPTVHDFRGMLQREGKSLFWEAEELKTKALAGEFDAAEWERLIRMYAMNGCQTAAENLKDKMTQYQEAK